tara:strand:+ start:5023 stop:5970 length:948 start_codon:yes stop_codon:yes gene_type:complete
MFLLAKVSYKLKLVDLPDERKVHSKPVAYTGGIIISIILFLSILFFDISNSYLIFILLMALIISIFGLIDDKYHINATSKLCLQIIPILYLIFFHNLSLDHLGNYNYINLNTGILGVPITLICVLFLINSFNYFDGLDGTLGFSSLSTIFILLFLSDNEEINFFLLVLLIPLIVYLFFNFSIFKLPKIFMGDNGSLLLGFIISFILIYLSNQNVIHPILIAWSIVIFVYEFLSVNLIRLSRKKNLFLAGNDHLHHILFKNTNSLFLTNFLISLLNIIFFIIGYISFVLINSMISLILFILLFFVFYTFRSLYSEK